MKEHLEVINHIEALAYVKGLIEKYSFNEELLAIHYILARGVQLDESGKYRKTEINIDGIKIYLHIPTINERDRRLFLFGMKGIILLIQLY
jgi:hypothetical protein